MSIVAVSETYDSQGTEIGRELSRALGWEFADREIIAKAAERYGESVMDLHHVSEEKPTLWERFSDSTRHYVSCIEATIFETAARGDAVLVGHGAAIILREIPHVLRVRVTASETLRARRARDLQGLATDQAALEFVRSADRERAARIKFLYHVDIDDPLLYDMTINTDRVSEADGVRIVQAALQGGYVQSSARSLALARDLSLAAQTKARLLVDPATRGVRLGVTATDGRLTLAGTVDSDELGDKVLEIASTTPGVTGVANEIIVMRVPRRYPAL
ncbi:MAG: cytidylate kinase family protein [Candidatus Rokuibacteriota bacterium]